MLKVPPETAQKQINALNKVVNHVLEQITHSREDWENEATVRAAAAQTCVTADTHTLIAAVGLGKNLKTVPIAAPTQPGNIHISLPKFVKLYDCFAKALDARRLVLLPGRLQVLSRLLSKQPVKCIHTTDKKTRSNKHYFHVEILLNNF